MYWMREIAGWLLLVFGLWLFYHAYATLLSNGLIIESFPTVAIGIFVFRGGIHLLKVAVAARVCNQSPRPPEAAERPTARVASTRSAPRGAVVPGKRTAQPVTAR